MLNSAKDVIVITTLVCYPPLPRTHFQQWWSIQSNPAFVTSPTN